MTSFDFFAKMFKSFSQKEEKNMETIMIKKCADLSVCGQEEQKNTYGQETLTDSIREKAYYLWEAAGKPNCDGMQFWLDAEKELSPSN